MECSHCQFKGELLEGVCPQCGYDTSSQHAPSALLPVRATPRATVLVPPDYKLMRGDMLHTKRYRLLEEIPLPWGQQDQGSAYLAHDTQNHRMTVLIRKIVFPEQTSHPEKTIQALTQRLMDLAKHPGFLPVIDVFRERGEYYIVQLYPEGQSLAALLKQQGGALPEHEVAEYGFQVSAMLSLLAQYHPPLVHGSISPETILISPDKHQVWLLLFPLFPLQAPPKEKTSTDYLAPEQIRGECSPSSDLYSLAATLHHAVTGYDPHERLAFFYPPVRRLNPTVTPQMEAILAHALRLSTPQRFTHPSQMQQELSALITSYPPVSTTSATVPVPFLLNKEQIRQLSLQKSRGNLGIISGVSVLILIFFLIFTLYPLLTGSLASMSSLSPQQELALELQAYRTKDGIGLSDGRLAFDVHPGRVKAGIDLKQQAASALQQGNISHAIDLLTKAIAADPADGEARIYNENLHISQSGAHFISIVIGLPIDNDPSDLKFDRSALRGAFLAQHEINSKGLLPGGLQLRLLIDNSGGDDDIATAAQFIANRIVKAGNFDHIVAAVGWPFSQEVRDTNNIFSNIPLPMVLQNAASVKLGGSSPYFFRISPPNNQEGKALGSFAVQQLQAKTVLVLQDPTVSTSSELANGFSDYLKANHGTVINDTDDFREETTTVAQYEQTIIPKAMAQQADLIFLAGCDTDGIRLAHALGEMSRTDPTNTFLANLQVLGGNDLDSDLLLGLGDGNAKDQVDAAIAANFPQDMQRLIFDDFASRNEWTFQNVPQNQQPALFTNWSNTYQHAFTTAGNNTIMTYDAVRVIADAARHVSGSLTGQSIRDALASLGYGKIPAFQGASGRISFDNQGNARDKALAVLDIENVHGQNRIALRQVVGKFF